MTEQPSNPTPAKPVASTNSAQATSSAPPNSINVNKLGRYLDGWADLIEDMGEKSREVRTRVLEDLTERNMPAIKVSHKTGIVSEFGKDHRAYIITQTAPGATTTIYISNHGKDLYASWRTYVGSVPNLTTILLILVIAGTLGFVALASEVNVNQFSDYFDYFNQWFSLIGWLLRSILFLFFELLIVGFAGRMRKGNYLAYFLIEPTIFDADDITAMSLSAHKSLLRALDTAGIDNTKLRLKQNFKSGRQGEDL